MVSRSGVLRDLTYFILGGTSPKHGLCLLNVAEATPPVLRIGYPVIRGWVVWALNDSRFI